MKKYLVHIILSIQFSAALISGNVLFAQVTPDSNAVSPSAISDSVSKPLQPAPAPEPPVKPAVPAQGASSVIMEFVKEKSSQSADSVFFNILKITNNNGKPVQGVVRISVPFGWKIISQEDTKVDIAPGNTEFIPIRVSLSRNVTGGVSYLINASLISDRSLFSDKNQNSVAKACYVTIPKKTLWEVIPVGRTVYFDRFSEYAPMKLRLVNKGNGNQLVKLEFTIGSALEMYGSMGSKYFTSFEMKPHQDSILTFNIKYLPPDESTLWDRDIRKLSIRIVATSDTIVKKTSVNFKYLESSYRNLLGEGISPLNIDVRLQNLLSDVLPRMFLGVNGNIQFKNDHALDYYLRIPSIPFAGYNDPAFAENLFWRGTRFRTHYNAGKWQASIGDVAFEGESLVGLAGRGVAGSYRINSKNEVGGSFAGSIASPIYNAGLFHRILLPKSIDVSTSVAVVVNNYNKMNNVFGSVQAMVPLWPGHRVTLLLSGSQTQHLYTNQSFVDASGNTITTMDPGAVFYGGGARLRYSMNVKKARASLVATYTSRHFSQYNNGRVSANANGQYFINKKYFLVGNSNFMIFDPLIYTQGILRPYNKLMSGAYSVDFANRINNKLTLFAGPDFNHTFREQLKSSFAGDSTFARFSSISPKLSVRASYKNRMNGTITPAFSVGRTFINRAEDSTLQNTTIISKTSFFNASAGLNVMQNDWGLNVNYYYGPHSIVTQTDYYFFNTYSKSIRVMPYFQKYFFNRTLHLRSYNNYQFYASSNSERITLNATLSFFLGRSWTAYVDNNMFLLSKITTEGDKVYSRAFYFSLGVRKSFDIPQPGIKYYDLKVVCFKDLNGNGIMDDNEQGLSDIVITVDRGTKLDSVTKKPMKFRGQFVPVEMITDNYGQVVYYRIPEGDINLSIFPLMNLKDVFNVNGQKQTVNIARDTTYYIPFVQTFRVNGNVIVNRDEFSNAGAVSTANIRITATDSMGNSFPTLTASDGSYALYVPKAGNYKVTINNIFGDQFFLQESSYEVSFNGAKEFHVDFIFNEKKRLMNINGITANTSTTTVPAVNSSALTAATSTVAVTPPVVLPSASKPAPLIIAGKDTLKDAKIVTEDGAKTRDSSMPVGPGISYRIQLMASSKQIPASQFEVAFKGIQNVQEYSEAGIYKYTSGEVQSVADAQQLRAEIRAKGFKDAFIVPFYNGTRVKY